MAIIHGANTLSSGYDIDNSCRFDDGSSTYLKDSTGNAAPAGNRQKFTYSVWFKRCKIGVTQMFAAASYSSGDEGYLYISGGDVMVWHHSSSGMGHMVTTQVFRDTAAWYHLVWAVDTTQGTAANRMKFYINGTQVTSFSTETYPDEDKEIYWNVGGTYYPYIGRRHGGDYFDGYMAEVVHIDNAQLAASSFGEFDSSSPTIWKPIDPSDLTFGTAGYWLDFEDSSDLGKDVSGVGNHFVSTNLAAIDQTTDTPTNNFCVLNSLDNEAAMVFAEGNLETLSTTSNKSWVMGTFALTAGKWYWEAKLTGTGGTHSGDNWNHIGISNVSPVGATDDLGGDAGQVTIFQHDGKKYVNAATEATYAAAWATNDIIGVALDCDNNKIYFSKGGAWATGSGAWDSTTFDSGVGDIDITAPASTTNGHYFPVWGDGGVNVNKTWQFNFGNPVHSISSGNTDGNDYGNFEYAVPSGYYSICSKNLGAYGG